MRVILRANGTKIELTRKHTMDELSKLIGAKIIDTVTLTDRVHVMLVNDNGHRLGLPANNAATVLYHAKCRPGSNPPPIVGDVAVVPDNDFADEAPL
jgi:hypothetical protein